MLPSFKRSSLAVLISLMVNTAYANNPQPAINLTEDISNRYSGNGVTVGVVDSGFILSHILLENADITPLPFSLVNPFDNNIDHYDPSEDTIIQSYDPSGHSTKRYSQHGGSVTGIITADSFSGANYLGGIAKDVSVYVADFISYNQTGRGDDSGPSFVIGKGMQDAYDRKAFSTAIDKVVSKGAFVVNNSWNEDPKGDSPESMDNAYREGFSDSEILKNNELITSIKNAVVNNKTLFTFAAGNEQRLQPGIMAALPRYIPELEKHFVSVVATDSNNALADYSNHCGVSSKWCIAAPGRMLGVEFDGAETGEKTPVLGIGAGTSFATPVVTGSLAILKERFDYFTPSQVRDTLFTTATDLGDEGVDDKFGWGLVNISQGINGPMQLLSDEVYTVTREDTWTNPLDTKNHKFTKKGNATLTLASDNKFNNVEIDEGRLNLSGATSSATRIDNNAALGINNKLNANIVGSLNSTTYFDSKAHWILPTSTVLGNVEMQDGAEITLNANSTKAGGSPTTNDRFNILTINNNLNGNGQFNFLTKLENWQGDKVYVDGIASGNFKLNVENTGTEPTDANRLRLMQLRNESQTTNNLNVELVNPVDFGTYRYELLKDDQDYRLYNPKKEQEIEEARLAEIARKEREQQARLQAEQEAKLAAQRALEQARQELIAKENARQAEEQAKLAAQNLATQTQSQLAAEKVAKEKALEAQRETAKALEAQRAATLAAEQAKAQALAAKNASETEKEALLAQVQQSLALAQQKEQEARQAQQRAIQAEAERQTTQNNLAVANTKLAQEVAAKQRAEEAQRKAQEALAAQTAAVKALEKVKAELEAAQNSTDADVLAARQALEQAKNLAEQKAKEAEVAKQAAENAQKLANDAEIAKQNAEQDKQVALVHAEEERLAREKAERAKAEFESIQNQTVADLNAARKALEEAQRLAEQRAKEAELARQAAENAEKVAKEADIAREQAEQAKADADKAKQAQKEAEEKAKEAEIAREKAEQENAAAEQAQKELESAKNQKDADNSSKDESKQDLESAKAEAEQAKADADKAKQAQQEAEEKAKEAELAKQAAEKALMEEQEKRQKELALANAKRKQAELISRYSNTALSELSAQVNSLLQLGSSLDKRIFEKAQSLDVWSNLDIQNSKQSSDNYRGYQQDLRLSQVGAQFAVNDTVDLGLILSESKSKMEFDDKAEGKSRLLMASAFAKAQFDNGIVAFLNVGAGQAKNKVTLDGTDARFKRNIIQAGVNLGYNLNVADFHIQPSIGARYYHLERVNYSLDNANINTGSMNLVTYQAGLNVGKTFNLNGISITPSVASYYVDSTNKKYQVKVNDIGLVQQFAKHFNHEFGLSTKAGNWEVSTKLGITTGNEIRSQKYWGVNLGYRW